MQMSYERKIIDPILKVIKDNQDYLCQPENLPQLAKLGYMYNSLWYAGRTCWGCEGILKQKKGGYACEENPKYKIEKCEANCEEHENLIYDAWGMHVSNEMPNWAEFENIIFGVSIFPDFEYKLRKINKTFDEWVEVLTDAEYKYSSMYPNRRAVANHLLCVIGNGYGLKNGYVIAEASGADQDQDLYGFWENAIFSPKIEKKIRKIMSNPIVQQTLDATYEFILNEKNKRNKATNVDVPISEETLKEMRAAIVRLKSEKVVTNKAYTYYPICNYSIITQFDENTHPSYIQAGIEICEEILQNQDAYLQKYPQNITFAEDFLKKYLTF